MDLRITEIFLSIQGESSHAGRPCSFVRLTGCPMRCVWCDSEYTFYGGKKTQFAEIFAKLGQFGCKLVEVTGGEPLAQKNVFPFITGLCDREYEVLLISPVHGLSNLAEIAEAVSQCGLPLRLNLQMHKYIWGADARGV